MMYLPSKKILGYMDEVYEWMYVDKKDSMPKLRDDAPEDIRKKRAAILEAFGESMAFSL